VFALSRMFAGVLVKAWRAILEALGKVELSMLWSGDGGFHDGRA